MLEQLTHPTVILAIVAIASLAGILGGLLGVGGSIIIIPGLYFIIGPNQQLYQAACMIVNVFIAIPATLKHRKAKSLNPKLILLMLPASIVMIFLGVYISNLPVFRGADGGIYLGRILAVFLVYVVIINVKRLLNPILDARKVTPTSFNPQKQPDPHHTFAHTHPGRCIFVGICHGFSAGLMGIGGGAIAVPLQQVLLKLPLKNCIANSACLIVFSSTLGATYKNTSLSTLGYHVSESLVIAAICIPAAFIASRFGASLTYKLPIKLVRIIFIILIAISAYKLAQLPFPF
ncbi:sulfite exporter TauE/SafE family protein [Poriferisphaera sp. WC338]|uniref:sulfite exporter TauE/SafE family protein n=1 Tax=Poriferisphaera sp. WC338 TaxID=3425129 RepID=UPI003D812913